jgi:hypothetical protein
MRKSDVEIYVAYNLPDVETWDAIFNAFEPWAEEQDKQAADDAASLLPIQVTL